jgi:hemerythrin-like domain-containing protein
MTSLSGSVSRRAALAVSLGIAAGAALVLPACAREGEEDEGVSAVEDLMREHGIVRRVSIIYRETAPLLRSAPANLDAAALGQAAGLVRAFIEDYHEARLEEQHVFPAVRRIGGEAGALVDTLLAQHRRGREITDFVQARCGSGRVATADAEPLARALESFARMYDAHAAYEDTIVFQAWKESMSAAQLHETGEQFEEIEHATFHGDGFDIARDRITDIERRLGLHDLGRLTAPAPA